MLHMNGQKVSECVFRIVWKKKATVIISGCVFSVIIVCFHFIARRVDFEHTHDIKDTQLKDYVNVPDDFKINYKKKRPVLFEPRYDSFIRNSSNNFTIFTERSSKTTNSNCVPLHTMKGDTPICIYNPKEDMISGRIFDFGSWEPELLAEVGKVLTSHPEMELLDIGCNIGVFSLFAAKLGHRVVAVEPLKSSLKLLSQSLSLSPFKNNVTLIWNCISDVYEKITLLLPDKNKGGGHVKSLGTEVLNKSDDIVDTILIDDLTPLFQGKRVFIKIDIEGFELRAVRGASRFLQDVDVQYILMEWIHHKYYDNGKKIIDSLIPRGMFPYSGIAKQQFLEPERYHRWPENVFWIKR